MRTMLIPLILICSLTQFVSAQGAGKTRSAIPNCGGDAALYHCYAPEICTDVNKENDDWKDHGVAEVLKTTLVTEDCPVILKYHMNSAYSMFISIESLQGTVTSAEFTFLALNTPKNLLKQKFSCEMKGDKIIGMHEWGKLPLTLNDIGKKEKLREDVDVPPKMLKCEYTVRSSSRKTPILKVKGDDLIMFSINGIPTKETTKKLGYEHTSAYCNPDDLMYYKPIMIDHNKLYEQVQYLPGTYECKEFYDFEYREADEVKENAYKHVTLTCPATVYIVGADNVITTFNQGDMLDVRCAADAKYFCNNNVKIKQGHDGKGPKLTPPDWQAKTPTKLECPQGHALVIDGEPFPTTIPSPSFQCVNYGSKQLWTVENMVNNKIEKIRLTEEDGPEVYCSDDLKCHQLMRISGTQVLNGLVDSNDYLPKCHDKGTLHVGGQKVASRSCDKKTGKFVYFTEAESQKAQIIDADTQFVCRYPESEKSIASKKESTQNEQIAIWGATGCALAAGALIGLATLSSCLAVKHNEKRQMKKEMAANDYIWQKWCMNKDEKKARKEEEDKKREVLEAELEKTNKLRAKIGLKPKSLPPSSAPPSSDATGGQIECSLKWNELIMSSQYRAGKSKSRYVQGHDEYTPLTIPLPQDKAVPLLASYHAHYKTPQRDDKFLGKDKDNDGKDIEPPAPYARNKDMHELELENNIGTIAIATAKRVEETKIFAAKKKAWAAKKAAAAAAAAASKQ